MADALSRSEGVGASQEIADYQLAHQETLVEPALGFAMFSACSEALQEAGRPTSKLRALEAAFAHACARFERSAASFLRALDQSRSELLVVASKQAEAASRLLGAATAKLDALDTLAG